MSVGCVCQKPAPTLVPCRAPRRQDREHLRTATRHPSPRNMLVPCTGYFLRDVAYFFRFYVFYTKYHPLLCLAEASRLGHPFGKSAWCMRLNEPPCQGM